MVSPATGHSALGSDPTVCARRAFDRFFRGGRVPTRCGRARRLFRPSPPPPRSLAAVDELKGVPGARGRTLTTVGLTLRDVLGDVAGNIILDENDPDLARGGGLRAGRYRLGGRGMLVLERLEFVPGVRLSGRIRRFGERRQKGTLRVSGRGVAAGRLVLSGSDLRGRLAGRRVRAGLVALTAPRAQPAKLDASRIR